VVRRELLTPYGLRTLSPADANYQPRYRGDLAARDRAYHQGTVWPYLLGPYITALVKVKGSSEETRREALELLGPLREHLTEYGLGTIGELFEAQEPFRPDGCISQAWSVGEVLRAYYEDILGEGEGAG